VFKTLREMFAFVLKAKIFSVAFFVVLTTSENDSNPFYYYKLSKNFSRSKQEIV
jgi:hypothetical protein